MDNTTPACEREEKFCGSLEPDYRLWNGRCIDGMGCCFVNRYLNSSHDENYNFSVDYMTHFTLRSFLKYEIGDNISRRGGGNQVYYPNEVQPLVAFPRPLHLNDSLAQRD